MLKELGAKNVVQSGKNDLTIDGKKVSGAAMMLNGDVIYGGNSLLYKVDYDAMVDSLNPNRKKIEAKGVKSIRQRVAPLSNYFDEQYRNLDIFEFKDLVIKKLFGVDDLSKVKRYELTEQDWAQVDELVNTKYKNWDWNYGLSPRYEYNRDARLAIGTINFSLAVEGQRMKKSKKKKKTKKTRPLALVQLTSRLQWRPKNWKNQNKWRLFAKKNITELGKVLGWC